MKKSLLAVVVGVVVVATTASPASAGTPEGTITLRMTPPVVISVPDEPVDRPCDGQAGYGFDTEASGTATSGDLFVDFSGTTLFRKPGSSPTVYDQIDFYPVAQDVEYTRIAAPDQYALSGTLTVFVEFNNLDAECETVDKCTFGLILVVDGSSLDNDGQALPPITKPGAVAVANATTDASGGLGFTYLSGDCDEYLSLDSVHVNVSLTITA